MLRYYVREVSIRTSRKLEIIDITDSVLKTIRSSGIKNGLLNLWTPHTTAAITINEHDPDLWDDILKTLERLVPIRANYRHNAKYGWIPSEQNAHAHIISSIFKPDVTIPVENGSVKLGSWQSILFIELDGPRNRRIRVTVMGE